MKTMISLAALFAATAFVCACSTPTPDSPEKQAINAVFKVDSDFTKSAGSISQIVTLQETISLNGCPADFKSAYKDNTSAWKKFAEIEKKMYAADQKKAAGDISTFLDEYRSNSSQAFVHLKAKWKQFDDSIEKAGAQIRHTKTEYINIGMKYYAVYPKTGGIL